MEDLKTVIAPLVGEEKIKLACDLLGKDPKNYSHLDRGRMAMTGGNLLRLWVTKEPAALPRIAAAVATMVAARPADFDPKNPEKSVDPQQARLADLPAFVEYKVTDADVAKWEAQAAERDALATKPRLWAVATDSVLVQYCGRAYPVTHTIIADRKSNKGVTYITS